MVSPQTFLSRVPIFSSLSPGDLDALAHSLQPVVREAGQVVLRKGDPAGAMYLIRKGKVGISLWTEDNQEFVVSVLGEGDFFGELALLDGAARTATVKTLETTELLELARGSFLDFVRARPEVAMGMMGVIAGRLRSVNEMLETSATRNANEAIEQQTTFGERVAGGLAQVAGSWAFLTSLIVAICGWMVVNALGLFGPALDPYPFSLLSVMLACLASLQVPVIMMSQNRDARQDRLRADLDYQVNLKAELQIKSLHVKLDELRANEMDQMRALQQEQSALLREHQRILAQLRPAGP